MADRMIRVEIAHKFFGEVEVLRDIRLALDASDRVAIMGPSGIGKSTALRIIAGLDDDFTGSIARPEDLAFVFQEPTLLPWRSAIDNILLMHRDLTREAAQTMLQAVGLADKSTHFPGQLSLGQQRRLALARAFAGKPELLLMDEPFASLDQETASAMLSLTRALLDDKRPALIFVTHNPDEAKALDCKTLHLAGHPASVTGDALL